MKLFLVDIGVKLANGAKINLTPRQTSSVQNYVNDLLSSKTGEASVSAGMPEKKKHKKRYMFGRRAWTPEEENRAIEVIKSRNGQVKNNVSMFRELGRAVGRTPHAAGAYYQKNLAALYPIETLKTRALATARAEEIK